MSADPGEAPVITARPAEMSADEVEATVAWLAKLPLRELRRRQDLVNQQIGMAHGQRNAQGLTNLRAMADMLFLAVDRQCFASWG